MGGVASAASNFAKNPSVGAFTDFAQKGFLDVGSLGLAEVPGTTGKVFSVLNPLIGFAATTRSIGGINTFANAGKAAATVASQNLTNALNAQTNAAADAQKAISLQPQLRAPDNFLANKNRELQSLRMGIAATMRGGAAGGPPMVSAPTLKGKLGQ